MKELTPEQQQVVDKAAKKHATHTDWDCKREPYNWTDQKEKQSFKAGVTFALSTPSLYMGLMEEFAEWIRTFEALERQNGQWVIESQLSDKDIVKAFIEDIKQKQGEASQ